MGLRSKVIPFPAEVKLRGRQRGSKMEKRWGSKEGERGAHTHTDRHTEPEDRMGTFAEGPLVGGQAAAAWGQLVMLVHDGKFGPK